MSDFPNISRRLVIKPARQVTAIEAANMWTPVTKYLNLKSSRSIGLINTHLILPAVTYNTGIYKGSVVFQYNFAVGNDFYFMNAAQLNPFLNGCLTVKYRRGNFTYRYFLYGNLSMKLNFPYKLYKKQLIKANCSFEFFFNNASGIIGLPTALNLKTSIQSVPADGNQKEIDIYPSQLFTHNDMGTALPAQLSFDNTDAAWLDNNTVEGEGLTDSDGNVLTDDQGRILI